MQKRRNREEVSRTAILYETVSKKEDQEEETLRESVPTNMNEQGENGNGRRKESVHW